MEIFLLVLNVINYLALRPGGGAEGDYSQKNLWGCAARFSKALH